MPSALFWVLLHSYIFNGCIVFHTAAVPDLLNHFLIVELSSLWPRFAENNDAMKIAHLLFHSLRINFQKANLCVKGQMKSVMISTMYCQSAF